MNNPVKVQATVSRELPFPAHHVWNLLEDFGNIHWAPGIDQLEIIGEGIGMIRRLHINGLEEPIDEQLEAMDSQAMTFSYVIPTGLPFPLKNYRAISSLTANGNTTTVTWRSDCEPDGLSIEDSEAMLEGTYNQLIDWITDELNKRHGQ